MPEENQYKPEKGKVDPLILDMLNRAFDDQKEKKKAEKSKEKDLPSQDQE